MSATICTDRLDVFVILTFPSGPTGTTARLAIVCWRREKRVETFGLGDPEAKAVRDPRDLASVAVRLTTTAAALVGIPLTPRTWKVTDAPAATAPEVSRVSRNRVGARAPRAPAWAGLPGR